MTNIFIRRGEESDQFAVFGVFRTSLLGLLKELRMAANLPSREEIEALYPYYESLLRHLFVTCDQFWVAETDDQIVGYARSILRDGIRQLSEFFVLPEFQSQGIGRQLLDRAFPDEGANNRVICASPDPRALSRYLKTGLRSQFTIYEWTRKPEIVPFETDLEIRPIENTPKNLLLLNEIDRALLGYTREIDHHWLIEARRGHFYLRKNKVVGYSYFGNRAGPIAMLHNQDFSIALAHVESEMTRTVDEVYDRVILCVPMTNHAALDYVLKRDYHTDSFFEHFLSEKSMGRYENYIFIDPILIT
jgi:GNAT superfamily N-acetyltransferase